MERDLFEEPESAPQPFMPKAIPNDRIERQEIEPTLLDELGFD
jgi:hypothetical protein